jgi:hypothetical protein
MPVKPTYMIKNQEAFDAVAHKPRLHLGDVQYEVKLEPEQLVPELPNNRGFKSRPKPLPQERIHQHENCTLTVKIPRTHLHAISREEITARGFLWGTGIYTDDSDMVAACIHGGWIRGEWPDDVDVADLDLDEGLAMKDGTEEAKRKREAKNSAEMQQARKAANAASMHECPPETGPVPMQPNRDLHVTILILPRLKEYTSTTMFGIRSRGWGGNNTVPHDGISFAILNIRWVDGAGLQSRLRGAARRARLNRELKFRDHIKSATVRIEPVPNLPGRSNGAPGASTESMAEKGGDETWIKINGVLTNKENEGAGGDEKVVAEAETVEDADDVNMVDEPVAAPVVAANAA